MSKIYEIQGKFTGVDQIVGQFKRIQQEVKTTSRVMTNATKEERQVKANDERIERQFWRDKEREARRAATAAMAFHRQIAQENKRQRAQDLAAQRQYIQSLKKEQDRLRDSSGRATRVGAVGMAGMLATGAGLKVAGNLQDAMDDVRMSIMRVGKDGRVDLAALNAQMAQFEALAIRLGNNLPGSTRTMADLFRSLREGGLDAKQILSGAGEAAAYLAVTSKEDFEDLGKVYAQLSTMSGIKPEDQVKTADLLARINTISGYKPTQLIDAAKYAIPRGGMPLGLNGFEGLKSNLQVLGLAKRFGLEGTVGGEGLANVMERLTMHTPKAAKAGHALGLQFFDKKGGFLGIENMMMQLEKLNKLSHKAKADALHDIFGKTGKAAAGDLADVGLKGYKQYAQELNSVASLQDKINIETQKFSVELENIKGTAENAIAKTFLPMMQSLKPTIDRANVVLGEFGNFMGEHPTVAKYAAEVLALGSAALVGYGAFVKIKTAIQIYQITSKIAAAENGLALSLRASSNAATQLTSSINSASGAVNSSGKRLGSGLAGSITSAVKVGVIGFAIESVVADLMDRGIREVETRKAANDLKELQKQRDAITADMHSGKLLPGAGMAKLKEIDEQIGSKQVDKSEATKMGGYFSSGSDFTKQLTMIANGAFTAAWQGKVGMGGTGDVFATWMRGDEKSRAKFKNEQIPNFSSAGQMEQFMQTIVKSGVYDEREIAVLKQLVGEKYPAYMRELDSMTSATSQVTGGLRTFFESLGGSFPQPGGPRIPGTGGQPAPPKSHFPSAIPSFRIQPSSYTEHPTFDTSPLLQEASSKAINLTVHVDARGAADPAGTKEAVRQAVSEAIAASGDQIAAITETKLNERFRDRSLTS